MSFEKPELTKVEPRYSLGGYACLKCGSQDVAVIDSRWNRAMRATRRRRACKSCGERWTTYEITQAQLEATIGVDRRVSAFRLKIEGMMDMLGDILVDTMPDGENPKALPQPPS